jgi:hypothetical protein
MSASGEVIKSFLVGLGFEVDDNSLAKFNEGLKSASLRVAAVATAVTGMYAAAVKGIQSVSEGFEEMGYQYHIIAPAINKMIVLRHEMLKAYGAAGINIRKAIVESIKLNMSLAKTKFALEAIYKSTASKFFPLLLKQSEAFRKKLYENMPYILNALEKLVKYVFKAFDAVTQLGLRLWSILGRVYDFFVALDKATNGWSTVILAVVAAWKLLNLAFLATPLGVIITGLTALLALYDDFRTYQEGGKSFFNWGPVIPIINALSDAFTHLWEAGKAFVHLFSFGFNDRLADQMKALRQFVDELTAAFTSLDTAITTIVRKLGGETINKILDWRDRADSQIGDFLKSGTVAFPGMAGSPPLGGQAAAASHSNVNANMQTSITISGSPNADATARMTAQQQQNVNRDFVRNMKGSTR